MNSNKFFQMCSVSSMLFNMPKNYYFETTLEQDNIVSMVTFLNDYLEFDMETLCLLDDGTQYWMLVKNPVDRCFNVIELNSGGVGDPFSHIIEFTIWDISNIYLSDKMIQNHVFFEKARINSVKNTIRIENQDYNLNFDLVGKNSIDLRLSI